MSLPTSEPYNDHSLHLLIRLSERQTSHKYGWWNPHSLLYHPKNPNELRLSLNQPPMMGIQLHF